MTKITTKTAAVAAIVAGLAAGSYGVASAASGSGTATPSTAAGTPATAPAGATASMPAAAAPGGATAQKPWGTQRSDEKLLTGDALAKVTAIAKAKVPGGTIVRVETDADGVATYEAHMTKADGSPVTVYVDSGFQYVSTK